MEQVEAYCWPQSPQMEVDNQTRWIFVRLAQYPRRTPALQNNYSYHRALLLRSAPAWRLSRVFSCMATTRRAPRVEGLPLRPVVARFYSAIVSPAPDEMFGTFSMISLA